MEYLASPLPSVCLLLLCCHCSCLSLQEFDWQSLSPRLDSSKSLQLLCENVFVSLPCLEMCLLNVGFLVCWVFSGSQRFTIVLWAAVLMRCLCSLQCVLFSLFENFSFCIWFSVGLLQNTLYVFFFTHIHLSVKCLQSYLDLWINGCFYYILEMLIYYTITNFLTKFFFLVIIFYYCLVYNICLSIYSLFPIWMSAQRVKHLKLRPDILNMIEEKVKSTLILIGTGKDFLKRITIERALRKKIGAHKTEKFLYIRGHHHRNKTAGYIEWDNSLTICIASGGLM